MTYCAYCDNTGRDYAVPSTPCSECKINETLERALKREEALQQRQNAADQRLDQAVTALNEIARVSRMGEKPFEIATLAIGEISAMVEQPASVAVVLPERSPKDYAIEHAEYMAKSADDVLAKFQAYGLALLAADEGGDDGEGELFEAIDSARDDLQESLVDLRGTVYEFRKRSAKI